MDKSIEIYLNLMRNGYFCKDCSNPKCNYIKTCKRTGVGNPIKELVARPIQITHTLSVANLKKEVRV